MVVSGDGGGGLVVEVGGLDDFLEALGNDIQGFLVKFADDKNKNPENKGFCKDKEIYMKWQLMNMRFVCPLSHKGFICHK